MAIIRWKQRKRGWEKEKEGLIYFRTRQQIKHRRHRFLQAADHGLLSSCFHQDPTPSTCKVFPKDQKEVKNCVQGDTKVESSHNLQRD